MKIFEFDNVSRGYGAGDVLSRISFRVDRGEVIRLRWNRCFEVCPE
jgi:ABC-type sugar transport system ATPase subunit